MAISSTVVNFSNTDSSVTLTGDRSVDALRDAFKGLFPWVTNASVSTEIENGTKIVTFSETTGGKGF